MPKFIIKIGGKYAEWSTIVDAPVTMLMSTERFRAHYQDEYGRSSLGELDARLARADANGTSSLDGDSLESMIAGNRAGPSETCLTLEEIVSRYTDEEP